tara:strand:+ start:376 stop:618 length:243 start_codon:yes stop_codon:yes gene_type:complete
MNIEDFIFVDAEFYFAPLEASEPLGKAISISYIDKYPSFSHKKEILQNFQDNGLILVDYNIRYRPISEVDNLNHYNITKH